MTTNEGNHKPHIYVEGEADCDLCNPLQLDLERYKRVIAEGLDPADPGTKRRRFFCEKRPYRRRRDAFGAILDAEADPTRV